MTTTTTTTSASTTTALKLVVRRSEERGHADHGWLQTFHTFSFAEFQDSKHNGYGPLRVINEDRVAAGKGFGTHPHAGFEIFTYVISGTVEHKDSMGNTERLSRGAIQLTSAGTGITHSEMAYGSEPVHLVQIWAVPAKRGEEPRYYTREFSDEEKRNRFVRVVGPVGSEGVRESERVGEGPAPVRCGLTMCAGMVEEGKRVEWEMRGRKGYVHVVQSSGYNPGRASGSGKGARVRVGGGGETVELGEGDGGYVAVVGGGETVVVAENLGTETAEVLLFDME